MSKRKKQGWCRSNSPWHGRTAIAKVREFEKAILAQREQAAARQIAQRVAEGMRTTLARPSMARSVFHVTEVPDGDDAPESYAMVWDANVPDT